MSDATACRLCGSTLPPQARFCKECGAPTDSRAGAQPAESQPHHQPPSPVQQMHYPQTPQPQPSQSPFPSASRSWPAIVAAIAAIALVATVVVVLVVATGGAGSGVRATAVPTVTSAAAEPSPNANPGSSESASQAQSSAGQSTSGSSAGALVGYHGTIISAAIPSGWRTVENEAHKPGYVESKWQDPANPGNTVLIDTSPATPGSLQQDAAPVHQALTKQSGYSELFYGSGDLGDVQSWKWVFRVEGDQRVDYFFNHCASGYAMLGSTPPARFSRLEATFKAVAESVRPGAGSQC